MEEKNLTPNESIRIISQMIEASKHRVAMPDTRVSVMWAALRGCFITTVKNPHQKCLC